MELIYRRRRPFSLHTRLTIVISLVLIAGLDWIVNFRISPNRRIKWHDIRATSHPGLVPIRLRPDGWFSWAARI